MRRVLKEIEARIAKEDRTTLLRTRGEPARLARFSQSSEPERLIPFWVSTQNPRMGQDRRKSVRPLRNKRRTSFH
jgi:hypothetical protein